MIFFYWIFLSGTVFIVGALIARIFITSPSGSDICIPSKGKKCLGDSAMQAIFSVSVVTLIVNIVHLILHCSVMTMTPLNEVFSVFPLFLLKTKYGVISLIRVLLLVAIILLLFYRLKNNQKWVSFVTLLFSLFVVTTLTMTGHQGTKGYVSLPFFLDLTHFIVITLWIGSLFYIRYCYSFLIKGASINLWNIFLNLINRFSKMATISVGIVVITGLALSLFNFDSFSKVISTQYGIVLLVKTFFVATILLFGALNKFFIIPYLNNNTEHAWIKLTALRNRLHMFMTTEVVLGLIILLATSVLTHLSPGNN
jgi:putative copper export protein